MQELMDRIRKSGQVLPGYILKIDDFLATGQAMKGLIKIAR